jgi:hypothetical protein
MPTASVKKSTLAERAKFQFEADSEDEEEEVLESDAHLCPAAKHLRELGRSMALEPESQNHISCRGFNSKDISRVDDQIKMNRARLDRIK